MIRARIKIGDGEILDTYDFFRFIYVDADERTESPMKEFESTTYTEESGEHVDTRTVSDVFDYKVTFLIEAPNKDLLNANSVIARFNRELYEIDGHVRRFKRVEFYNDYNRVKIVGIPRLISEPKEFFRHSNGKILDCVKVEFTIHVDKPDLCDYNLSYGDGKNLLTNTLDFNGWNLLNNWSRQDKDGFELKPFNQLSVLRYLGNESWRGVGQKFDCEKGKIYTFSAYIKRLNNVGNIFLVSQFNDTRNTTPPQLDITNQLIIGQWVRVNTQFSCDKDDTLVVPRVEANNTDAQLQICGYCLEEGAIENPQWSASYNDRDGDGRIVTIDDLEP